MTTTCLLPEFSLLQATELVAKLFRLDGTLLQLNGERDLNFLVDSDTGKFVFKIANQNESLAMLKCQHLVFQHLSRSAIFDQQTLPVASINNKTIETVTDSNGISHHCRVLPYIEGRLLSSVNPHFPELLLDLGKKLAHLDHALMDFRHEALERPLLWKIHQAQNVIAEFKPLLACQSG